MIGSEKDKEIAQNDFTMICKWAKENLIEFTEENFEQANHGTINNMMVTPYKGPKERDWE